MKHKLYKTYITFFAIGLFVSTFAQKFDKKFSENFKTNKDVEIAINATYTDINVSTWNKNEVQVNAFIEIEGITKKEAEQYFKDWEFEALGNSKKVKITSNCSSGFNFKNDFVFFDNLNFDFQIPDIDLSDIDDIVLPNMDFDFDFDFDFEDLDDLGDNMDRNEKYEFTWKDEKHNIKISSKEEWEAFKKTKDYEELKKKMKVDKDKVRKEIASSKEKIKLKLKQNKVEIDKNKIREQLEKAKEELKKLNFHFNTAKSDMKINGKKVKIKKTLEIRVPKSATFNLNTRHCKVKLPNTVAFGNVKYGSFDANNLSGGKLTIDSSPVKIKDLNTCTLFLNNVTDAKIASVTNTTMNNNSSGVHVLKINNNVTLSDKFGEITIGSFHPNFGEFVLNLSQSNATIILGNVPSKFTYDVNRVKIDNKQKSLLSKKEDSKNLCKITGEYSSIVIK